MITSDPPCIGSGRQCEVLSPVRISFLVRRRDWRWRDSPKVDALIPQYPYTSGDRQTCWSFWGDRQTCWSGWVEVPDDDEADLDRRNHTPSVQVSGSSRNSYRYWRFWSYNCCCLCILEVNRIASNSKSSTTPPLPSCLAAASSSSRSPAGLKTGFHSLVWVTFCYRGMRRRKLTFWLWGWVFRLLGGSFVFALRSQNASALETINIYLWRMVGPQLLGSFRKDWLTTSWMASGCRMTSLLEERRLGAFLVLSWRRRRRSRGGRVVRLCLTTRLHPLWSRLWPRMRRTRSEPSMWIWGISLRIRCWLYSKLLVLNNMRQQRSVSRRKAAFPRTFTFNRILGLDYFFISWQSKTLAFLNVVCHGSNLQQVALLRGYEGGTPNSKSNWKLLNELWVRPFGLREVIITDGGGEISLWLWEVSRAGGPDARGDRFSQSMAKWSCWAAWRMDQAQERRRTSVRAVSSDNRRGPGLACAFLGGKQEQIFA